MSKQTQAQADDPSEQPADFASAVTEIESILSQMETGNLPLEASISAYQRGASLLQYCQQSLAEAEQQVRVLSENNQLTPLTIQDE
jgi:exodeoxyribonuclease VII small subunit